jgi:hypothetical protein
MDHTRVTSYAPSDNAALEVFGIAKKFPLKHKVHFFDLRARFSTWPFGLRPLPSLPR